MAARENGGRREAILLALGCVVVVAEVILVFVQSLFPAHPVPTEFHGIAFVTATSLFGSAALSARRSEKNGNGGNGA